MSLPQTEMTPQQDNCIDAMEHADAVIALVEGQIAAVASIRSAQAQIVAGAKMMAQALRGGGRLNYVAAGSSGLMALADGSELPGTFGIPQDRISIHMAGGVPVDGKMPGDTEDDVSDARTISDGFGASDLVIALSASGTTPYPVEIADRAHARGIKVIAITNNAGVRLLLGADVGIVLPTPPEVLAGSTRLGAGTAQKVVLNTMSTLAGVMLGHVQDGMMVNLHADNAKLRRRAKMIVAQAAGVAPDAAETALRAARGNTKLGVLLAKGCPADAAARLLEQHQGHLRPCLGAIADNRQE